jgi:hypothetical protein
MATVLRRAMAKLCIPIVNDKKMTINDKKQAKKLLWVGFLLSEEGAAKQKW